ncbi:VWA domain-containing protein, partial [Sulfurovum sp. bin170]|uniref:vWA domain-containing protein n=1 Tax=Sulfurovum sp. bin170 TaxID=2695268 RepID=UPI0013DFE84D
ILIVTAIFAEQSPRAVIVFDASGSMWGQIDGKAKIEIARDALKNVVNEWNPKVELGLTVYGHRKKGDCNDIETLIPVGKIDKKKVISTIFAIKPKGKTPISRSIKKAAEELKYTEEKATIILISDGKETCDPDPCAMAKELEEKGIDFVTHVVGFNVDKKTDKELECIAKATGGEYFSAKNATALNEAMKSIVKKVEKVEPKPEVKKPKNSLEITATEKEGGKWIEAYHAIYPVVYDYTQKSIGNCWSKKKKECLRPIPSGKYLLKSKYNEFKKETPFEIKADEVTKLNIVFGQTSKVEISATEKEGGKWVEAYHAIYPVVDAETEKSIGNCWSKKKKECFRQIPVGKYLLKSKYNEFKKETPFELKADKATKLNIIFGQTGTVEISGSETEGGKWVSLYGYIYPADENGKKDGSNVGQVNNRDSKEPSTHKIPAGKYIMEVKYNNFKKEVLFEVIAGKTEKVHVVMGETGTVEISASKKKGGKWVQLYGYIYPADENGKKNGGNVGQVNNRNSKDLTVYQLPVGRYIMNVEHNDFEKEVLFEVTVGKTNKVHVIFTQFTIGAKCSDMSVKVNYEIYAESGRLVYEKEIKCSDTLKVVLDSGNYKVEAKIGSTIKEGKFTVGGDSSKLTVDMTDIKKESIPKESTKEELIKADSQASISKKEEPKSEPSVKTVEINGIDPKDLEEAGKLLNALGGMFGAKTEQSKDTKAEQDKANKEFDEMSQELDMFSK